MGKALVQLAWITLSANTSECDCIFALFEMSTEFVPLRANNRFEICTSYPYVIRNNVYTPMECINGLGYPQTEGLSVSVGNPIVKLGGKIYFKHRLVAEQFIPNPDNKRIVRHINGDRTDYHIDNLYWK